MARGGLFGGGVGPRRNSAATEDAVALGSERVDSVRICHRRVERHGGARKLLQHADEEQENNVVFAIISKRKGKAVLDGFSWTINAAAFDMGALANREKESWRRVGGFLKSILVRDAAEGMDPARYQEFDKMDWRWGQATLLLF